MFLHGLNQISLTLSAVIIPIASLILLRKLIKERKSTGQINIVRFLIFTIFLSFSVLVIFEFFINGMGYNFPLLSQWFGSGIETIGIYAIIIGVIATLGLTLISYANRWEIFYYTGLFIYGGMLIFYFATGYDAWHMPYVIIAGVSALVFLYFTGFRIKDNGALGLAIFFTLALVTVVVDTGMINNFIIIGYNAFIVVFVLGFFKPFKQEVVS